jgi:hypothetical protein
MRRFDTPTGPLGWAGLGAELLRIVDPTGRAIAWLAPGFGANCVGYAVRHDEPAPGHWQQIFHAGSPRDLRAQPLNHGCAILGPEPNDGSAHLAAWRFVERDPTAATCSVRCGAILLDLTARLEDAALHLDLLATNEGSEAVTIASGLRLNFNDSFRCDISPLPIGQPVTLQDADLMLRLAVASQEEQGYRWCSFPLPGGTFAIEARHVGERKLMPGEQNCLSLVILPGRVIPLVL